MYYDRALYFFCDFYSIWINIVIIQVGMFECYM